MEIEFSRIDDEGKPLLESKSTDELTIFLDMEYAEGTAKRMLLAVEELKRKSKPDPWLSFLLKGKIIMQD